MRRLMLGVAGSVLSLSLCGSVMAHEYHGPRPGDTVYYRTQGHPFAGGWYYPGRDHRHWSFRVHDAYSHRYHYYDPYLHVYYYWDPTRTCYYPVGY